MIARYAHIAMETPRYEFSKSDGECIHLIFLNILKFERQFVNREKFTENRRVAEKSGKLLCN